MRTLKRIVYVYEDTIIIGGHHFRYETTKDIKKDYDNGLYTLYDIDKKYELLVASTILTYEGVYEIARAYLADDKQVLKEAIKKWCICY